MKAQVVCLEADARSGKVVLVSTVFGIFYLERGVCVCVYVCVRFLLSNQLISLIDSFPINSQDRNYHHVNVCPTDLYHCPQLRVNQGDSNNSRAVFPHSVPCVPGTLKITFSTRRACQVNSKTLNILSNQKPTRGRLGGSVG